MTNKLKRACLEPGLRKLGAATGGVLLALPAAFMVVGEDLPPLMQAASLIILGGIYLIWMRPRY